jgi:hypothetical protein
MSTNTYIRERNSAPRSDEEHRRWLLELVSLEEGARLRNVGVDTLRREYRRGRLKLEQVSQHRFAIRRAVALNLPID